MYIKINLLGCFSCNYRKVCDTGSNYKGNIFIQATKTSRSIWLQVRLDLVTQHSDRGPGISSPFLLFIPQVQLHPKADSPWGPRMVVISFWDFTLIQERESLSQHSQHIYILGFSSWWSKWGYMPIAESVTVARIIECADGLTLGHVFHPVFPTPLSSPYRD